MQFFYEKTDYSTLLSDLRHEEFKDRKEWKGYCVWTDDDEEDLRNSAKDKALFEYIRDNLGNKDLIINIPKSLKPKANVYYAKLCKNK